jgi:hypothetical protein
VDTDYLTGAREYFFFRRAACQHADRLFRVGAEHLAQPFNHDLGGIH